MKKLIVALALMTSVAFTGVVSAQGPPPPPEHGQGGNQPAGGGAPIAGGLAILLALGAAYTGKKIYDARKKG